MQIATDKRHVAEGLEKVCAVLENYGTPLTICGIAEELNAHDFSAHIIIAHAVRAGRVQCTGEINIGENSSRRTYKTYACA